MNLALKARAAYKAKINEDLKKILREINALFEKDMEEKLLKQATQGNRNLSIKISPELYSILRKRFFSTDSNIRRRAKILGQLEETFGFDQNQISVIRRECQDFCFKHFLVFKIS